jgi:phosphatidylglycerophosphate synthase
MDVHDQITDAGVTDVPKGDCYSAGERAWMEYGQQLRAWVLAPWLSILTKLRVGPDHLTVLSLLFGLSFAPLWYLERAWLAVIALGIHVALDGLDGPLARFQKVASHRGSFTDSFCDQLVVSTVIIMLMTGPPRLSVAAGAIFLVVYTGVLAIAMVRNSLQVPYSWLVRPRFFLFLAIPLQLLDLPHSVATVVWVSNVLLGIKLATGFFKLRQRLDGPVE